MGPSACAALLCLLLGFNPGSLPAEAVPVLLSVGGVGLVFVGVCAWQWFRPARAGAAELPRCLLLALPATYLPALLVSGLESEALAPSTLLVPRSVAVIGTVYLVAVGLVFLARQPLSPTDSEEELAEGEAPEARDPAR